MKAILTTLALLLAGSAAAIQAGDAVFFKDGKPEVVLGAYFNLAGTDTVMSLEADTLSVYLVMWNAGLRGEGEVAALEYRVELPEGLKLIKDELPDYSHLCIGTVEKGFSQTMDKQPGDGLLVNTLRLYRTGTVSKDARVRILPHPETDLLQWVAMPGGPESVRKYMMLGRDAILKPELAQRSDLVENFLREAKSAADLVHPNIVQAIARDCLAEAMLRVSEVPFLKIVMHVHDEIVCEANTSESLNTLLQIMNTPIEWAPELQLKAAGYSTKYYKKD